MLESVVSLFNNLGSLFSGTSGGEECTEGKTIRASNKYLSYDGAITEELKLTGKTSAEITHGPVHPRLEEDR